MAAIKQRIMEIADKIDEKKVTDSIGAVLDYFLADEFKHFSQELDDNHICIDLLKIAFHFGYDTDKINKDIKQFNI